MTDKDEKKDKKSDKEGEGEDKKGDEVSDKRKLSKFITLKDINMQINKGEFICIIGDVGSGKSSLLHSVIGDLLYLPQKEIERFGGFDHEGTQEEYDALKNRILGDDINIEEKPIKIRGSVSYVE